MKKEISRAEAMNRIGEFFEKEDFSAEEMRKIKKMAMMFKIRLGDKRRKFCKKCLNKLVGKTRIAKRYKAVECKNCGYTNRLKINYSE